MTEPSKDDPKENLVIPKEKGIGTTAWSRLPRDIYPIATELAVRIAHDPLYEQAYKLSRELRRAEDLLKMTRSSVVGFQNIPPKEEDPDIENRWSDEAIEARKKKLQHDSEEYQDEATRLNEELREKSKAPEFLGAYEDISSKIRSITKITIEGLKGNSKSVDVHSQSIYNSIADELIDYNLGLLLTEPTVA